MFPMICISVAKYACAACMHTKSLQSCPTFATLWTVGCQAPLSMGFSRQESWSGLLGEYSQPRDWTHVSYVSRCVYIYIASQVALVVKNPPANAGDTREEGSIPGSGRSPGGGQATHSRILAWRIPWTEEPGGLQSMGSQRVGHNWSDLAHT